MAPTRVISVIIYVVILFVCDSFVAGINECQQQHFNTLSNSTQMQFTTQAVTKDYALRDQFKSLHCCARGYRSIQWFKNGQPFPWSSEVSSFNLYPSAQNQTIYTQKVSSNDAGNYTCIVRNDTHKTEHFIEFNVQVDLPDTPLATFKPQDQYIELGEEAQFYCEAFVGSIPLPDSKNTITWYQTNENGREEMLQHTKLEREDGRNIGSVLKITSVQMNHYRKYTCRIEIGNSAHRLEMSAYLHGTPIPANTDYILPAILLALGLVATIVLMIVGIRYIWSYISLVQRRNKKLNEMMDSNESIRIHEVV